MKLLIIDDEPDICEIVTITFNLRWPEAKVITASTGARGLELAEKERPDVIILDLGLPDVDGFKVCQTIRESHQTPILILSARDSQADKVKGLNMGADDYIVKPFSHLELLARVRAILRRRSAPEPGKSQRAYESGNIRFDFDQRRITVDGKNIELPPAEYSLLYHLVKNADRTVSNKTLLAKVWGREYTGQTNHLKVFVQHLQAMIEEDPVNPRLVVAERSHGYRFVSPV